ncbi:hypothetical protein N658DRAFT_403166, partial [Parathielavia hyrcaniae]
IDKPAVKPPFSEAAQNRDLDKDLPPVPWIHEAWDPDWLPQACVIEANYTGFDPSDFQAIDVTYKDCAASWTVCRHREADESWFYILETISKVPVGLRQYISTVVVVPEPEHSEFHSQAMLPSAYARPEIGVLTFMPSYFKLGIIFHEAARKSISFSCFPTVPSNLCPSYRGSVSSDRSVTTAYARTSWEEGFADAVRWAMSHMTHRPGGLASYSRGWGGCRGQIEVVEELLRGVIWPVGGRCVGRVRGG